MRKEALAELFAQLRQAAVAARENNQSTEFMDADNRRWFVGCENVDSRANVLIQAKRGQDVREAYLPTNTFTPDAAAVAVNELHGALS